MPVYALLHFGGLHAFKGRIALYAACTLPQARSKLVDRNPLRLKLRAGPNPAGRVEILSAVLRTEPLGAATIVSGLELGPAPYAGLHRALSQLGEVSSTGRGLWRAADFWWQT